MVGGEANKIDVNTATSDDFKEVAQQFGQAAVRARLAGYDCVQIHAGHGYLIS